jgi:hypothetical protein
MDIVHELEDVGYTMMKKFYRSLTYLDYSGHPSLTPAELFLRMIPREFQEKLESEREQDHAKAVNDLVKKHQEEMETMLRQHEATVKGIQESMDAKLAEKVSLLEAEVKKNKDANEDISRFNEVVIEFQRTTSELKIEIRGLRRDQLDFLAEIDNLNADIVKKDEEVEEVEKAKSLLLKEKETYFD